MAEENEATCNELSEFDSEPPCDAEKLPVREEREAREQKTTEQINKPSRYSANWKPCRARKLCGVIRSPSNPGSR